MKKKLLLVISMVALFVCVFAITVSATCKNLSIGGIVGHTATNVTKTTNGTTSTDTSKSIDVITNCTNNCPIGLAPAAIEKAYAKRDAEALVSLQVTACMECGSCSYLCPAHRPLVQTNKLAKALVKEAND